MKYDNNEINSIDQFMNKIFSVKKGTEGSRFAEDNKERFNAEIKYFNDSPSMYQEVINSNADVAFEDYPVIAYKMFLDEQEGKNNLKIVGEKLNNAYYGFAVKNGENKELLDMFNSGLKKLKESGEYNKILSKYIKVD